jgi:hypothetical protein
MRFLANQLLLKRKQKSAGSEFAVLAGSVLVVESTMQLPPIGFFAGGPHAI